MMRTLRIEFQTAVHHGTGHGVVGMIDRAALRDASGMPYLSGAALKGKFRFSALRILGAHCCEGRNLDREAAPPATRFCIENWCDLCRLFGSPMHAGAVRFEDACPVAEHRAILETQMRAASPPILLGSSDVRARTAIDRARRTARRRMLFSTEAVSRLIVFQGGVLGELDEAQERMLDQCAAVLNHFGADSARGLGFCRFTVVREEER